MIAAAAGPLAIAQNRDTLETRLTASGDVVLLEWSRKHPWDRELLAGGAFLMAEYRDSRGQVGFDCLQAGGAESNSSPARTRYAARRSGACPGLRSLPARSPEDRVLRFRLPESLNVTPEGPVCLYIRMPDQRLLPVRKGNDRGDDTARFRYEPWEKEAVRNTAAFTLRAHIDALRRAKEQIDENIGTLESINASNGWHSPEACGAIKIRELSTPGIRPVAPPSAHDAIARLVCIMRVANAQARLDGIARSRPIQDGSLSPERRTLFTALDYARTDNGRNFVYPPGLLTVLFEMIPEKDRQGPFTARIEQLDQLRSDWIRWSPGVEEYRKQVAPHFGQFEDLLDLQTLTVQVGVSLAKSILDKTAPKPVDLRGFIGASLEAYGRCLADGKNQLETSYRNAMELRASTPALLEKGRAELMRVCLAGIGKLEAEKAEGRKRQEELDRATKLLEQYSGTSVIASQPRTLNSVVCVP